ncbi:hypothetical protein SAMN05216559_0296 [Halomicrobium zhouii]|uniref:PGF-CTERM protein n=1 Tax=Halomicrobium zhouii TaxID=767519 RepID=A0A1I6K782_9EURY|nr:hypothetical protein [Halomicrobium zhouii]SFR87014.1 hypothetical protein SAMN05216559_0296 [Halomicrobium zhouii]
MNARTLTALLAVVVVVSLAPAAGAQSGFEISSADTTPVPERTETVGGNTFTIDSTIRADEGDTVTLDVTAPNDDNYRLHVRNSENQIIDQPKGTGDESFTFDLSNYEYGSYAFAVYDLQTGDYQKVQPLLVSGYDVSVDAPGSVSSDGSAEVTVDLTETAASGDPANVQVIAAQGDTTETFDASGGDGEYTATVDGGALEEGDYTVYAVAQGDEEAFGRSELLGLSDGHALAVESGSGGDGDSGGSGGDGTDGSESTEESETTDGDDANESDGSDGGGSDGDGANDGGDSDDESTDDGAANPPANETTETETTTEPPTTTVAMTETATDTDDGVVTPADDTETETETEATGLAGPGFTAAGALAALVLVGLLGRRRL